MDSMMDSRVGHVELRNYLFAGYGRALKRAWQLTAAVRFIGNYNIVINNSGRFVKEVADEGTLIGL